MAEDEKREDPVLVRPYVKAVAEAERAPDEQAETWPATADEPREADTLVQPAVEDEPPAPAKPRLTMHPLARAGIFVGGVAVALGVVGYLIFGPAADPALPQPGVALPAAPGQAPLDQPPSAGPSAAKASVSASASVSAGASVSASPSASFQSLAPLVPSGSVPPPTSAAPPTTEPTLGPPAADRTGQVTAASGRCLALGSLFGSNGSPVNVSGCMSVAYQSFTLATDGTLRVNNKCAQSTGDGTVRVTDCGDGASSQWRAGDNGTLINGGGCLTDPGRSGATTTVSACSGGSSQSWTLP
ncbi:ricin-type beta-trefoil lectin domain protein [Actinoplanes sp. TRM 88003]|uniref:Ricin-type beta-trefoil lectin domain protein n=1 Tax=Paractinoplanes aksuensis TaxID=2939490 RepID=A0ABT1DKR2_9ACTN|nr:RICIN domain-containing protein [Actinoplanes aksuensis]MCO8271441.1 ricin-type beta-trefoil lectin domain protein [Actinoplanes aksuensis]